jgi:glycosyltransferase involved in cell wall biosynthesis
MECAGLDVRESAFRLEWMDDPWEDVARAGDWLLLLEDEVRPDVVHLNGYAHGALPWRAPALVVAHSCVLSWWRAVKKESAPPKYDRYRHEVRKGLDAAKLVVAPTAAMLRALIYEHGPVSRACVIFNARLPELFRPAGKEPLVFTAARLWDEAKNAAVLDSAAEGLAWPVYAAGDTRHPDGSARAPAALRPLGALPQDVVAEWLGRASIYALPARYEPFGLSALEAALSSCALLLGDIPSLREVWGETALYLPPEDSAAWREGLRHLIARPDIRSRLGEASRRRARRYSPEIMAKEYLSAYQLLLQGLAGSYDLEDHSLPVEADI